MLLSLTLLPVGGALFLWFIPTSNDKLIRLFSLFWSLIIFNLTVFLFCFFDPTSTQFQLRQEINWIGLSNLKFALGIDGLGLLLALLTAFLTPICVLLSWNFSIGSSVKKYNIAFLALETILFGVFFSLDTLLFYVFFEAVLIPMYYIVGIFGSRKRRIRASYPLFLYTLVSSILMFVAILYIHFSCATTDLQTLKTLQLDVFAERRLLTGIFNILRCKNASTAFSHMVARSSLRSSDRRVCNTSGYSIKARWVWFSSIFNRTLFWGLGFLHAHDLHILCVWDYLHVLNYASTGWFKENNCLLFRGSYELSDYRVVFV